MEQVEESAKTGNVINRRYERVKFKKGGKIYTSQISGDAVSRVMLGATDADLHDIVDQNGLVSRFSDKEYPNQGMFRMAVGQALRGKIGRGETVQVGKLKIKTADQEVKSPFVDK